ncbi:MAG: hypothetical protein IPM13_17490 [Phycisphaerales bacterium]|nr:hypothetical protein [Phycisphaerales bacterium]
MIRNLACISFLLTAPALGQIVRETFDYPDGPVVPGWTQQRGMWEVVDGRIASVSGATWAYITKDGLTARNCVIDGHFKAQGFGIQFGGLTTRHPGGDVDANLLMGKLQRNGSATTFDRMFAYERPLALGEYFVDLRTPTRQARVRMITLDSEFWLECDGNFDGVFEESLPRRPIAQVFGSGLVGMAGFANTTMDDFAFFDAVLVPQPGAMARVGSTFALHLSTPSPGVTFLGLLSLGRDGIPLGERAVPLTLDEMLTTSLSSAAALGLLGTTDGAGGAYPGLRIPNVRSLIGLRVFAAAVTIDVTQPFAIKHISNEQFFTIQS